MLNFCYKLLITPVHKNGLLNKLPRFLQTSTTLFFQPIDPREAQKRRGDKKAAAAHQKALVKSTQPFDSIPQHMRTKETFEQAVEHFQKRTINARGHVDFIYAALRQMKTFNVHEDLEVYKKLVDLFPVGKMKATNVFQTDSHYYPRHQDCCMALIDQFTFYQLCPDKEIYKKIEAVFGNESNVMRRLKSSMYWMPKAKNADPYPVPRPLPNSELELAKIIMDRMCRDPGNATRTFFSEAIPDAKEDTWLVSGQSPLQQDHIEKHQEKEPLYIDGPFRVWAGKKYLYYYMLSAEANKKKFFGEFNPENQHWHTPDEWERMDNKYTTEFPESRRQLMLRPTIHEQQEGTVLGLVITGSGSKESLAYWLLFLQQDNPRLGRVPVIFRVASPTDTQLAPIEGAQRVRATANLVEPDVPQ